MGKPSITAKEYDTFILLEININKLDHSDFRICKSNNVDDYILSFTSLTNSFAVYKNYELPEIVYVYARYKYSMLSEWSEPLKLMLK